jgi:hypothetical protein
MRRAGHRVFVHPGTRGKEAADEVGTRARRFPGGGDDAARVDRLGQVREVGREPAHCLRVVEAGQHVHPVAPGEGRRGAQRLGEGRRRVA